MTNCLSVHHYPVFEEGTFEKHQGLFDHFMQHASDHLKGEYQKGCETLHQYENAITWPLAVGPGFCGATHPGAANIFVSAMVGGNKVIYNSDCLYINPFQKVFAIGDSPGISTFSRQLFARLDYYLQRGSADDLETIINELNAQTKTGNSTTLSLICFPQHKPDNDFGKALAFVAGDTYLFYGNIFQRRMTRIEGTPDFIGMIHIHLKPQLINLREGDFFVIASDGILSIRGGRKETNLENILLEKVVNRPGNFALNVIKSCNKRFTKRIDKQVVTRFGGGDNVSALLVFPEKLKGIGKRKGIMLGGYIIETQQMNTGKEISLSNERK